MIKSGELIDKYRIIRKLNSGVTGDVYLVEIAEGSDNRWFALKQSKDKSKANLLRFRRETATLARLKQANLVQVYHVVEDHDLPYFVMDYVPGETLESAVKKRGTFSEASALECVRALASALVELQKYSLVHRDLKPANIIIGEDGVLKLIDFGLVADIQTARTENQEVGTPLYCSPEQAGTLRRPIDFSSDLYSLGVIYFELLTGRPPFSGALSDVLHQHATKTPPALEDLNPSLSRASSLIVKTLLSKDPDDRYDSAAGLLQDLSRIGEIEDVLKQGGPANLNCKSRRQGFSRTKFVDRPEESARILRAWEQTMNGFSSFQLVSGPSGSGKSRLCEEFVSRLVSDRKNEIFVLRGKCEQNDRDSPFSLFRQLIDNAIELLQSLSGEERAALHRKIMAAATGLESDLGRISKAFRTHFPAQGSSGSKNEQFDVATAKERFLWSIATFFHQLAIQWNGVLLLVDDVQWMDKASSFITQKIFDDQEKRALLLVGTGRDDTESKASIASLVQLFPERIRDTVELRPFSEEQALKLVADYLGTENLSLSVAKTFHKKANGNPFIIIEYVRSCVEQGLLQFKDARWLFAENEIDALILSSDVYELIIKRIEGRSQQLKIFLQYAAIFGSSFYPEKISAAAKLPDSVAKDLLVEAQDLGILERAGAKKFKFSHDRIPESLRGMLPGPRERELSLILADFIERSPDKSDDEIFTLARIYMKTDRGAGTDRRLGAAVAAGTLAIENQAFDEAFYFLKYAFETCPADDPKRSLVIAPKLAISAVMTAEWQLAENCAEVFLLAAVSKEDRVRGLCLKVWVYKNRGDITSAWEYFRVAAKAMGIHYPSYLHWKVLSIATHAFFMFLFELTRLDRFWPFRKKGLFSFHVGAADLLLDALHCVELRGVQADLILISLWMIRSGQRSGSLKERALGYSCVSYVFCVFKISNLAIKYSDKAMELAEELNDPCVRAFCLARRISGFTFGNIISDDSVEFGRNVEFLRKNLNPAEFGRFCNNHTWFLNLKGRNEEALESLSGYLNFREPGKSKIGILPLVGALRELLLSLTLLGRTHEVDRVKKQLLQIANRFRFVPFISRYVAAYEVFVRRYHEELDEITDDLTEFIVGRSAFFGETAVTFNFSQILFLDLLKLQKVRTREEALSIRRSFKARLLRVFLTVFNPALRINYFFLLARYNRILERERLAARLYSLCEVIALKCDNRRILYEVQVDRARMHLKLGNNFKAKESLLSAYGIMSEQKWAPMQAQFMKEFGDTVGNLLSALSSVASAVATQVAGVTGANGLSEAGSAVASTSVASRSLTGTVMGTSVGSFGDARIVAALLKVSEAFLSTDNLQDQARALLRQIIKVFSAERGFIFVKPEEGEKLEIMAGLNSEGEVLASLSGFSSTVVRNSYQSVSPTLVAGTDEAETLGSDSAVLNNLRSIMAVPIRLKQEVLGVVYLDSTLIKGLFTKADVDLFTTLANHISISLNLDRSVKVERERERLRHELDVQAAIAAEAQKVKLLVDNMQQAVFAISSSRRIVEPVSRYSEKVFGHQITGLDVVDVLFKDAATSAEVYDAVKSTMDVVFGEDQLQWDLSEQNIPKKIRLNSPSFGATPLSQESRSLKIQSTPIWNSEDLLDKIMFVVEDVTQLEILEREAKESRVRAQVLEEILDSSSDEIRGFLVQAEMTLKSHEEDFIKGDPGLRASVLRDLHSLKGNSRLYGLRQLSSAVHESESTISRLVPCPESEPVFRAELGKLIGVLGQYMTVLSKVSGTSKFSGIGSSESGSLSEAELEEAELLAQELPLEKSQKLARIFHRLRLRPMRPLVDRFGAMVTEISKQLSKSIQFEVSGDAWASPSELSMIQESLLHLLRNSLDHGFEKEEERVGAGKPSQGRLSVSLADEPSGWIIVVQDDGSGIDSERVLKKAIEKGVVSEAEAKALSEEQKLNLIFAPGFSTKDSVSDISGRGIGLDVVKTNIESLGGALSLETEKGKGSKFTLKLAREE